VELTLAMVIITDMGGFSREKAVPSNYLQFFQRSCPFKLSFIRAIIKAEDFEFGINLQSELACLRFKALIIDRTNLKPHKRN